MKSFLPSFLRIAHASDEGLVRLRARKIYIIPTRYGVIYGGSVFLMLIGSLNYKSNLGLLFCFLLASVAVVGIIHTWRNLLHLTFNIGNAVPVFLGSPSLFPIRLPPQEGRRHKRITLQTEHSAAVCFDVNEHSDTFVKLPVEMQGRGDWPLPRLRVSTVYPLGLFRAWCYAMSDSATALVYPQPSAPTQAQTQARYMRAEKGDKGIGADDFVGTRIYRAGDSPRHLDWKAFAREKGLVTRVFGGDRAERVWIRWDDFPGLALEQRLSALCRSVIDAAEEDRQYGLELPGQQLPCARGQMHKHRCLTALARFNQASDVARMAAQKRRDLKH